MLRCPGLTDSTDDATEEELTGIRERVFHVDVDDKATAHEFERFGTTIHSVVFPLSLFCIGVFLAVTIWLGEQAANVFDIIFAFINTNFGWFYILAVNIYLFVLIGVGFSKYGNIRLGGPDAEPEFSRLAWLAMLFSSGMGVGLLFFGVAEPTSHFLSGGGSFFDVPPQSPAAGRVATALTMFHWGFHPWGIYGIVGLGLAFFSFNRGLSLSFRSVFYPVLGPRIYGWSGHIVDLAAVIATVFGLATATGLAALQITAGLDFVATSQFNTVISTSVWTTIAIIAVIICVTTLSTWAGIDAGIKRLSKVNVGLMIALLGFVTILGPTVHLFDVFNSGLSAYLGNFIELSFHAEAFSGDGAGWQHKYTIFYWGFWIVWSPFVGMFLARISKGRTIREFVTGVLLIPVLFSVIWMAVFSGSALFVELNIVSGGIAGPLQAQGRAVALFELFSFYPLTLVISTLAIANLVTFIATSTDSGAIVTSYITAGGKRDTDSLQRVLWPILIGGIASVLLLGDGLQALQTAVIATGLPFAMIILFMVYAIYRGLNRELELQQSQEYREALADHSDDDSSAQSLPAPPFRRDE